MYITSRSDRINDILCEKLTGKNNNSNNNTTNDKAMILLYTANRIYVETILSNIKYACGCLKTINCVYPMYMYMEILLHYQSYF